MPARPHRRPRPPALAVLPLLLGLAGCSVGHAPTLGATGVDGLTVPTASPDPTAYVDGVDHPHLPLGPGSTWRLAAAADAAADADAGAELVLAVGPTREVAGVATTALTATPSAGDPVTAWLAEDEDGHVWLLAGEGPGGAWAAGEDGAEAGLLLAAEPRTGDGHALWARGGEPAASARVAATGQGLAVPWGAAEDVVVLDLDLDPGRPGAELQVSLGAGVGPVAVEDLAGGDDLALVARD